MSYLKTMRDRRKTPHAAWHKIRTTIGTDKFDLFAAFEGEADEDFFSAYIYQRDANIKLFPVICDGKGPLIALHKKILNSYGNPRNVFFFLDSDHDKILGYDLPAEQCFTTDGYSYESYGLSEEVILKIFENNFGLHPTDPLLAEVQAIIQDALNVFCRRARTIMTYVLLLRQLDIQVEVDELHFYKFFQFDGNVLRTKSRSFRWISSESKVPQVPAQPDIIAMARSLKHASDACVIRGKMVAQFLIRFLKCLSQTLKDRDKINGKKCTAKLELGGGNYAQQLSIASTESERLSDFLDDLLERVKGTAIAS
ncbi:hypothetical protein NBRC116586_14630 [Pseudooceanicola nitratireducens]|uniref:DUF4435 domain-containing protein n=1 Tax=Pseudooceanicola nitratireducens TaxID=517719 RepID=UPI00310A5D67